MAPSNFRFLIFTAHPDVFFVVAISISSLVALLPNPSFLPITLTLTLLLVYSRVIFHRRLFPKNTVLLATAIAVSGTLAKLFPAITALSTPAISVLLLFASSAVTSILTISAVYLDTWFCTRFGGPWFEITFFPALWATLWTSVASVSPFGRLSTWSSAQGGGIYGWMLPILGPAANDWTVGAWAVVLSRTIGVWYIGGGKEEEEVDDPSLLVPTARAHTETSSLSAETCTFYLAVLLAFLSIPSFLITNISLPIIPPATTPLSVGCVLPHSSNHPSLTLKDYIDESKKLTMSAKILLWPEGAVRFESETERDEAFAQVRLNITGSYVGISFEEAFRPQGDSSRLNARRTGIAIVSRSTTPHLIYYKRHLVPIAESFSLTHSTTPPPVFTLEIPHPKNISKEEWGPAPNYTRPVPITASICLDFADPSPFAHLEARPALLLAPARTWDISVGIAMWQQAKQRAEELGTMVLWCDGGDGGVSGIAGGGFHDFLQVGSGSWTKTIGIQHPFNIRRTPYVFWGSWCLLFFWAIAAGPSVAGSMFVDVGSRTVDGIQRLRDIIGRRVGRVADEVNLLD